LRYIAETKIPALIDDGIEEGTLVKEIKNIVGGNIYNYF